MRVSEYIAHYLNSQGVNDVFGIPGGVILDLIYAFDAHNGIDAHLCYHEQCAGFAACGYAQMKDTVGVAYATKGPGFTNLMTAIADAYYDSIPVVFITAHTAKSLPEGCRSVTDQDMDTCSMVANITKYCKRIDTTEDLGISLHEACTIAQKGRKGPVFLDIASSLFKQEITTTEVAQLEKERTSFTEPSTIISKEIREAERPIILVGDGVNQSNTLEFLNIFAKKVNIPVLSSRFSHNILKDSSSYYGYVGSHGVRYANFILSKADLIISLGNRLNFPSDSISYSKVVKNAKFIRIDIDEGELKKHPLMQEGYNVDLKELLPFLANIVPIDNHKKWLSTCNEIRDALWNEDVNEAVRSISSILKAIPSDYTIVSDVGNNEFWLSRACVYLKNTNRVLYSKSLGALGNALGKAIGAYYAIHSPVVVFVGDQGFQMNIQELQFITQHNLPITIVLLNNHSSGMIKDREKAVGYSYSLHTTQDSGYGVPDFSQIAKAYNIEYKVYKSDIQFEEQNKPLFIEVNIPDYVELIPSLPKGRDCQEMEPRIDKSLYNRLNSL